MQEVEDIELLRQYSRNGSEEAFAALVTRRVNLVYSAALRKTGNPHAAEEITQAVFIILAQKAGSLPERTILSGWLYQTVRLVALGFLRTETRRARREQEACMQSIPGETNPNPWSEIAPLLEDAMGRLGELDRSALVLRFFEGKSFQEIGTAFGGTENAAKKRVARGLEKLRKFFAKRGVISTTAIIAGAISANSIQAAPVALAKSVTTASIVKGSIAAVSTLTLAKETMKTMMWLKLKFALGLAVAALLIGGMATIALSDNSSNPTSNGTAAVGARQILVSGLLLKTTDAQADVIIKELTASGFPQVPSSKAFRDWLKQHPEIELLSAPQILTLAGQEGRLSAMTPTLISGKNASTGTMMNVTPLVQADSKINLKISAEFRELVSNTPPAIRVTKSAEQEIQSLKPNVWTLVDRKKIDDDSQISPGKGENLLVFTHAMFVANQIWRTKKTQ